MRERERVYIAVRVESCRRIKNIFGNGIFCGGKQRQKRVRQRAEEVQRGGSLGDEGDREVSTRRESAAALARVCTDAKTAYSCTRRAARLEAIEESVTQCIR